MNAEVITLRYIENRQALVPVHQIHRHTADQVTVQLKSVCTFIVRKILFKYNSIRCTFVNFQRSHTNNTRRIILFCHFNGHCQSLQRSAGRKACTVDVRTCGVSTAVNGQLSARVPINHHAGSTNCVQRSRRRGFPAVLHRHSCHCSSLGRRLLRLRLLLRHYFIFPLACCFSRYGEAFCIFLHFCFICIRSLHQLQLVDFTV